jgi:hypothetical protein
MMPSLKRRGQHAQALLLRGDSFIFDHRFEIVGASQRHGLPTMAEQPGIRARGRRSNLCAPIR